MSTTPTKPKRKWKPGREWKPNDSEPIPNIIAEMGELAADTIITLDWLSKTLHRHPVSVLRAVRRKELPKPIRLFGATAWTVEAIRRHIAERLADAAREAEKTERRISQLRP